MASERFQLLNEKEQSITGVIETEHPRKKQPAVIILNGFLDTMESPRKKRLAALFRKDGYVTVRFDYAYGFGTGSGEVAMFTLTNQVQDTEQVIAHVMRRGYVDADRIVLLGHCFGSMGAILLSAFDERVKALVALSTPYWFHDTDVTRLEERELARIRLKRYFHLFSENLGKEVRIDYSFFEDGAKKDMARAVRNLRQPLLLIHGRQDASIPVANSQEIYDRTPGEKELHIAEAMAHQPTEKDVTEFYPVVKAFLKKHLK